MGAFMSTTETAFGFNEFVNVYPSCAGRTHSLARLFDECYFATLKNDRHTISFDEATKRLRKAIGTSLSDHEINTGRLVEEFLIGKTSVKSQSNVSLNPMRPSTWCQEGRTPFRWREHKMDKYDGLIAVGCVTSDLIPKYIKETNKAINMDHHMYAVGLAQALIQHYMVQEPDRRLRNKSFDVGYFSEGKPRDEGGIIYVAYKLEPENNYTIKCLNIKEEDVKPVGIECLKIKLEEDGLYIRGDIPDDGNSFFKACSDQFERLDMAQFNHTELRQMVIRNLKLLSEKDILAAKFTKESWQTYLSTIANDKQNVEDIVVETMAKLLRRPIVVYSRSYLNEIFKTTINEDAKVTPLLLAKDKHCYLSLERRHNIPDDLTEDKQTAPKRPANTSLDDNVSPCKQARTPRKEQRPDKPTATTPQGARLTQKPQTAAEGKAAPTPEKRAVVKKMTKDEKMLILRSYVALTVKSDWDKLAEIIYSNRHKNLSRETIQHYEENLDVKTSLKSRVKKYIQSVQRGKRENEADQEVKALIGLILV